MIWRKLVPAYPCVANKCSAVSRIFWVVSIICLNRLFKLYASSDRTQVNCLAFQLLDKPPTVVSEASGLRYVELLIRTVVQEDAHPRHVANSRPVRLSGLLA